MVLLRKRHSCRSLSVRLSCITPRRENVDDIAAQELHLTRETSPVDEPPRRCDTLTPDQQVTKNVVIGKPAQSHAADTSSVRSADAQVAQAGQDTSDAVESTKKLHRKGKQADEKHTAKLVAKENESKSKLPKYPGLNRWELVEKMGVGAFSIVYHAWDREGKAGEVAIKIVKKYEMNNMQRSNVLKEVQIMRQPYHPNIIKFVDFSESKQYYYIILELAPGGALFRQIVRLTYFSEDLSRHVIVQVAKALDYLHEQGVVHRDIKPENILFYPTPFIPSKYSRPKQPGDEDKLDEGEFVPGVGSGGIGRVKIADFGLSKIVGDNQTMTPCGTTGYTAPEIVKDECYSKSVDMWALGCVLYTLLCGFPPFHDECIKVLTEKMAKGQYTFLSPWWDDISQSAQDLVSHLLTVDPDKRYTAKELLAHPWIRASGPAPRGERKAAPDALRTLDASRLADGDRRYCFRSPGSVSLREVLNVGYDVHRQEEEAMHRAQSSVNKGYVPLNEESEADKEGDEMMVDNKEAEYMHKASAIMATQALQQNIQKANIHDQAENPERESERPPAATQQGRGLSKGSSPFELNLEGATLLRRRGVKPAARVEGG